MSIISNSVNYVDGDSVLEGFFAFDDSSTQRRPAVLIAHAWGGRDSFVMDKAKQLAALGYVGFALDMYGHGKVGADVAENAQLMQPFLTNRALLQQRISAALLAVKLLPWVDDKQIAAIGYCFGGLCVLDLARTGADIKGVVSFHGLLGRPDNLANTKINASVLVLHGHDDPMVTPPQVLALQEELSAAQADWQTHSYGQTVHAFTNPQAADAAFGTVYSSKADSRSWQAMTNFLSEVFAD